MPDPSRQFLQVEVVEGVAVVRVLSPEIREVFGEHNDVQSIGDQLYALVDEKGFNRLVLNFSEVQYMASIMLGKLIGVKRKAQRGGGNLKLCRLTPLLQEIFRVSALDRVFEIYDDEHAALDSFDEA
jgi:anti-sigma B factor antagonist